MKKYDIAVIGGGPAGMIAAISAAESGKNVCILEKNSRLGKKLLITGKGRCNITNNALESSKLKEIYGKNGRFLYSSFDNFDNNSVTKFFNDNGLETKVERGDRIFPTTDTSTSVGKILENQLEKLGVTVFYNSHIIDWTIEDGKIKELQTKQGIFDQAENYILSTGGKSYPTTGSSGDGYKLAQKAGHTITTPAASLSPILTKEDTKDLQGLSLKNVQINAYQGDKKILDRFGEMLFTHEGLSGPIIIDSSKEIGQVIENGEVKIKIDLKPALDYPKLDKRLQKDLEEHNTRMFKNGLDNLLPQKMIQVILEKSGIDPEKECNAVTKLERKSLLKLLKEFTFTVKELKGFEKAIITTGGVSLKEIDPKTMRSKLVSNLYIIGEVLDIDGPTGGYNLQVCWSTGWAAGLNC